MPHRILVWDLPTRLFHWLLVALITAVIVTGKIGGNAIVWHGRIGLAIVGLLVFRVIWGFVGSTHARFASFFPTPSKVQAYFRGHWKGIGHNPLGALSVFGLLALIATQIGTGLFANDDIAFQGYLFSLIDKELSDRLTSLHKLTINVLFLLIALHLAAIMFYAHIKKDNLVKPMITGWKDVVDSEHAKQASGGSAAAFVAALLISLAAVYGGSGAWISTATAMPPSTATPASNW